MEGQVSEVKSSARPFKRSGDLSATTRASEQTGMMFAVARFRQSIVAALALYGTPATAQEHAAIQSTEVYGGELFGADLTTTQVSGRTPRLDDNVTYGARYTYNVTDMWGLQLSGGYDPTRASGVISRNLRLTTGDLDVVWNITPQGRTVAYAVAGAGYASAHLESPIVGQVNSLPVFITDSSGFTVNAGIGAKYYMTNNLFLDLDARYRYLNRLVNRSNQELDTAETTLGLGWRF
jgi:outer membrane beta-barrel protein